MPTKTTTNAETVQTYSLLNLTKPEVMCTSLLEELVGDACADNDEENAKETRNRKIAPLGFRLPSVEAADTGNNMSNEIQNTTVAFVEAVPPTAWKSMYHFLDC